MIVQNLKCPICGANKVTPSKSMYIYCDYCGSWMGYDMQAAVSESYKVFTLKNMNSPKVKEYNRLNLESLECARNKNKDGFVKSKLQFHELEFDLFPERHGPKGKQSAFRKKYMDYYKAMYEELVDDDYFERTYINPPKINADNLKSSYVDGELKYELDDAFFEFFDANLAIVNKGIETSKNFESMKLHPEYDVVKNSDLMYKFTVGSMIQSFGKDAVGPILKHLGMEDEMIEIPDVSIDKMNCVVCNAELDVPEGAKSVMCVECGCKNEVSAGQISCPNCAACFDPVKENETCPYCNSKIEQPKSIQEVIKEQNKKARSKSGKMSFWKILFGKR